MCSQGLAWNNCCTFSGLFPYHLPDSSWRNRRVWWVWCGQQYSPLFLEAGHCPPHLQSDREIITWHQSIFYTARVPTSLYSPARGWFHAQWAEAAYLNIVRWACFPHRSRLDWGVSWIATDDDLERKQCPRGGNSSSCFLFHACSHCQLILLLSSAIFLSLPLVLPFSLSPFHSQQNFMWYSNYCSWMEN